MSSLNRATKPTPIFTHEGAKAARITPLQQLIRSVMSCMLWEDGFYEDGQTIAARITTLVHSVSLAEAAGVAIEARNNMKLRHVPLLIVREMARHPHKAQVTRGGAVVSDNHPRWISRTLAEVIQRPDELTEFLAIYWKDGKQPLSKQVKLGLAKAFAKFNEYQLAKYNREKDITLKDVLFLCHSKPADVPNDAKHWDRAARQEWPKVVSGVPGVPNVRPEGFSEGELLYGKLVYEQLQTPDTWEVELSSSKDKHGSWSRLLAENKLGDLAFLRNLRNMVQAGIPKDVIVDAADHRKWGRVLPFRFIAAARQVPQFEPHLEHWMFKCLEDMPKMKGRTILLVDVSGSMGGLISSKSDLRRTDAAQALAMLLREVCEDIVIAPFGSGIYPPVPPRRGFALADLVKARNEGTDIGRAVRWANNVGYDRLIILTDEQSSTQVPNPQNLGYVINVAAYQNGIGYGKWLHIDGWSEAVIDYIQAWENSNGG